MAQVTSDERQQAILERRWKVWRLRVTQKLDISEIVQLLSVARRTVDRDIAAMRRDRDDHIRQAMAAHQAAINAGIEVIEECDAVCRQAWTDLYAAPAGDAARAKFLAVILIAIGRRVEILQGLGLLARAPHEVIVHPGDIRDLTDEEAERLLTLLRSGGPRLSRKARSGRTKPRAAARAAAVHPPGAADAHGGSVNALERPGAPLRPGHGA
jgi:hypothetical protein